MKNVQNTFTNRQLTRIIASIVVFLTVANILIFYLLSGKSYSIWIAITVLAGGLFLSFLLIKYLLEKYIYSKIEIIYKFLDNEDSDKREDSIQGNRSLDMVGEEVAVWAAGKDKEINSLKSLAEYRKSFVGNVSHELKTPIFTVQGYIHTLLDGGLYDNKINLKYLQRAALGVERLQHIVDDLEVITKLESGQIKINPGRFDIMELTKEIIEGIELMAAEKNIKIKIGPNVSSHNEVYADRKGIYQLMMNLVINSIKYGKKDGQTKIEFFDTGNHLLVEVTDNGIGIQKEHIKHLFDRFYRVDPSRSRQQGGSGLGLAIVKHIVEAHKGKITVRSTPNAGSTFGFTVKKA